MRAAERRAAADAARARIVRAPADARAHADLARALADRSPHGLRLLGRRRTDARAAAATAVRLAPDQAWTHHTAGLVELSCGRPRAAVAALRAGLALDPADPTLLNDLGVALEQQGLRREAIHAYGQASVLEPADSTAYDNAKRVATAGAGVVGIVLVQVGRVVVTEGEGPWRDVLVAAAVVIGALLGLQAIRAFVRSRQEQLPRADGRVVRELVGHQWDSLRWTPRLKLLLIGWVAALGLFAVVALTV